MIESRAESSQSSLPAMEGHANWIVGEPAVPDLLDDPLIHAVLRRDGLSLADLQSAIARARRRLSTASRRPETATSDAA